MARSPASMEELTNSIAAPVDRIPVRAAGPGKQHLALLWSRPSTPNNKLWKKRKQLALNPWHSLSEQKSIQCQVDNRPSQFPVLFLNKRQQADRSTGWPCSILLSFGSSRTAASIALEIESQHGCGHRDCGSSNTDAN